MIAPDAILNIRCGRCDRVTRSESMNSVFP